MEWLTILLCVTLSLPLIFLLSRSKNLPPGPPGLLFIAKFLVPGLLLLAPRPYSTPSQALMYRRG
jgi:hypothetical protein